MKNSKTKQTAGMKTLIGFLKCAKLAFAKTQRGSQSVTSSLGDAELTFSVEGSLRRIRFPNGDVMELDAEGIPEHVLQRNGAA